MMTLEQLPPKGVKREQAILELGKDEANGELLFQLVNTEKGKCKTAAQKALAQLEYAPAAPLWAKLVKGKWMGSHIMSDACSDCVSEQIAPVILKTLSELLDEGDTKPLEIEQLNFYIRGGEILGVAGIAGCGQKELCEAIAGLRPIQSGQMIHKGDNIVGLTPKAILEKGISMSFIPEDRLGMGLAPSLSITDNTHWK